MRVAQIEFALDAPARLIFQFAAAIEFIDQFPLGIDQRKLDFIADLDESLVTLAAVIAMLDMLEPVTVNGANRSDPDSGSWRLAAS